MATRLAQIWTAILNAHVMMATMEMV
jgi:hypothetical protein